MTPEVSARILAHLEKHPGLSAFALARGAGLAKTTVRRTLADLAADGEITCAERRRHEGDFRPVRLWSLAADRERWRTCPGGEA